MLLRPFGALSGWEIEGNMEFSIIVATAGRAERLRVSLAAICAASMRHGGRDEIVVVDNSPAGGLAEVASAVGREHGVEIRYVTSAPLNKAKALNVGIREARCDWLAFTDDDTQADGAWLSEADAFAAEGRFRVFGGRIEPDFSGVKRPRWLTPKPGGRMPTDASVVVYREAEISGPLPAGARTPIGANCFVHRAVFEAHGAYDEALWARCGWAAIGCEDGELGIRLRRVGEPIGYCAAALIRHPVYPERMRVRFHLYCAYRLGYRDPIVLGRQEVSVRWALRQGLVAAGRGVAAGVRRDWAGAVAEGQDMAVAVGRVVGRARPAGSSL